MGLTFGNPSSKDVRAANARLAMLSLEAPATWGEVTSDARWRWALDAENWRPAAGADGEEFQMLLDLLPRNEERDHVLQQRCWRDKKRSLLGLLLARRACARALGVEGFAGLEFGRTYGGKPFLLRPRPDQLPNFNYNISHDGRWVVLASDPLRATGVDVAAPQRHRGDAEDDSFMEDLVLILHRSEQRCIRREPTVRQRYGTFQRIWSAKEAVTKGVGQGLEFGMERISVTLDGGESQADDWFASWWGQEDEVVDPCTAPDLDLGAVLPTVSLEIDGFPTAWDVEQYALPDDHWMTVASGPVEEVVDRNGEFTATFRLSHIDEEARRRARVRPIPALQILTAGDLVPPSMRNAYSSVQRGCLL